MSTKPSKGLNQSKRSLTNWVKSFRGSVTLLIAAVFIIIPLVTDADTSKVILSPLLLIMVYIIFAASWDFLTGYTGQASFGHAIFMGVSMVAYSALIRDQEMNWLLALLIAALLATAIAFLIGIPLQRMSGPYFAVGTLTLGVVFYLIWLLPELDNRGTWTLFPDLLYPGSGIYWPGSGGVSGIKVQAPISGNIEIVYYITMAFVVVSLVAMILLGRSKMGTIFKAIRDDEMGAKASGINIFKYKMIALMISAFFAGVAGALFVSKGTIGGASTSTFSVADSFIPIIIVMLGGLTTISGSMLGAFIFVMYGEIIRFILPGVTMANPIMGSFLAASPNLIFAVIIMLILGFAPDGLMNPALNKLQKTWDLIAGK